MYNRAAVELVLLVLLLAASGSGAVGVGLTPCRGCGYRCDPRTCDCLQCDTSSACDSNATCGPGKNCSAWHTHPAMWCGNFTPPPPLPPPPPPPKCTGCGHVCDAGCHCHVCKTDKCDSESLCLGPCNGNHNAKWCGAEPAPPPPGPPGPPPAGTCQGCGYECDEHCNCGRCNMKAGCQSQNSCLGACDSGHNAKWCGNSSAPCPGGSLPACMALCPAAPPAAYTQCIEACGRDCTNSSSVTSMPGWKSDDHFHGPPPPPGSADAVASLLIACPQGNGPFPEEWIRMDFMRGLANGSAGPPIQVDYTHSLSELNRSRLFNYSAVLLFTTPGATLVRGEPQRPPVTAALAASFPSLLGEYASAGGGVFLFPTEDNWKAQTMNDLNDIFGMRFPVEIVNETSPANVASMDRFVAPLAFTSNVAKSNSHPTINGVQQMWYPTNMHYNAGETAPLCLTAGGPNCDGPSNWTALVRASPTAVTQSVDAAHSDYKPLPPNFFQRAVPEKAPPIFAIRTLGKGRVALMSQWRQYTITSGNRWLFDSQVLSRGVGNRSSDTGKLIHNTLQWLAAPVAGGPGGFTDSSTTLVFPNEAEEYQKQFDPPPYKYDPATLHGEPPQECQTCDDHGCKNCGITSGVIGVRTSLSSGSNTVAEYAAAARATGLGFIVFAEEWSTVEGKRTLTDAAIAKLKSDCKAHSSPELQLIPGMTIENNIGNKQIFSGPGNFTPPADALTNDSSKVLLQGVDPLPPHNFTGFNTPAFNWMLSAAESYRTDTHDPQNAWTVGYYHLGQTRTPGSMRMSDLRCYSMAAVAYYDASGSLVEELAEDFAVTIESTIAPVPVVFSDIRTVASLQAAAKMHLLTHVKGPGGPSTVFVDGLHWNSQYDAPPTFVSHMDGPIIDVWQQTHRVYTLGAERFSTGSALLQAGISVRTNASGAAIAEVNITNGAARLFRRFVPQAEGSTSLARTLLLDGFVHRNLMLTVVDTAGRKAYGSPLRTWKPGVRSIVFCGDHVNDCESDGMQLGHGPVASLSSWVPILGDDLGGFTWDGGPASQHPLLSLQVTRPQLLASSEGVEDGARFTQTPHLEFSDEGGSAVRSVQDRIINADVERVVNAWHTFGPISGPSTLFNSTQSFRLWFEASVGVPPSAYAGQPMEASSAATLFRNEIVFKKANTIGNMLLLIAGSPVPLVSTFSVVICPNSTANPSVLKPASAGYKTTDVRMSAGGWWALWSPEPSQTQLFTWRSKDDVEVTIERCTATACFGNWFKISAVTPLAVQAGDTLTVEFAQIGLSLLAPQTTSTDEVLALVNYINATPQLEITTGARLTDASSRGLLELSLDDASGVVAFSVPQAAEAHTMLPMRVKAACDRWSIGLLQTQGYTIGHYGNGTDRWTALGLSLDGHAHAPLFTGLAATDVVVGHPVIAMDPPGRDLFIQVTKAVANDTAPHRLQTWHVALNNPTDSPIKTRLSSAMGIAELYLPSGAMTIGPGDWIVLPQRP